MDFGEMIEIVDEHLSEHGKLVSRVNRQAEKNKKSIFLKQLYTFKEFIDNMLETHEQGDFVCNDDITVYGGISFCRSGNNCIEITSDGFSIRFIKK